MQKWSVKISEMLKFRGNLHQHLSSALTYAEEREEEYEKARRRIFNVEKGNSGGGGSSGSSGGEKQLQIHSDRQLHSLSSTKVYLSSLSAPWYIIYYIFTKYYLSSEKLRPTELEQGANQARSFDIRESHSGTSDRPPVSKSFSFGGYPAPQVCSVKPKDGTFWIPVILLPATGAKAFARRLCPSSWSQL